jgi:hypothetical protein
MHIEAVLIELLTRVFLLPSSAWVFLIPNLYFTCVLVNSKKTSEFVTWAAVQSVKTLCVQTGLVDSFLLFSVCLAPSVLEFLTHILRLLMPNSDLTFLRQVKSLPEPLNPNSQEDSNTLTSMALLAALLYSDTLASSLRQHIGQALVLWVCCTCPYKFDDLRKAEEHHFVKTVLIGLTLCCSHQDLTWVKCDIFLGLLIVPNILAHLVFLEPPPFNFTTVYTFVMCGGLFNLLRVDLQSTEVVLTVAFVHALLSLIVFCSICPPPWLVVTRFDLLSVLFKALYIALAFQGSLVFKLAVLDAPSRQRILYLGFTLEMRMAFAQTALSLVALNCLAVYLSLNSAELKESRLSDHFLKRKVQRQCEVFCCISAVGLSVCLLPINSW